MKKINLWISVFVLCGSTGVTAMADDAPLFDVPQLHDLRMDGDPTDWGDRGFRVGALARLEGEMPPVADLDAEQSGDGARDGGEGAWPGDVWPRRSIERYATH